MLGRFEDIHEPILAEVPQTNGESGQQLQQSLDHLLDSVISPDNLEKLQNIEESSSRSGFIRLHTIEAKLGENVIKVTAHIDTGDYLKFEGLIVETKGNQHFLTDEEAKQVYEAFGRVLSTKKNIEKAKHELRKSSYPLIIELISPSQPGKNMTEEVSDLKILSSPEGRSEIIGNYRDHYIDITSVKDGEFEGQVDGVDVLPEEASSIYKLLADSIFNRGIARNDSSQEVKLEGFKVLPEDRQSGRIENINLASMEAAAVEKQRKNVLRSHREDPYFIERNMKELILEYIYGCAEEQGIKAISGKNLNVYVEFYPHEKLIRFTFIENKKHFWSKKVLTNQVIEQAMGLVMDRVPPLLGVESSRLIRYKGKGKKEEGQVGYAEIVKVAR